jgi:hypothetical protein
MLVLVIILFCLLTLVLALSRKEPFVIEEVVAKYPSKSLDLLYQAKFSPGCCPSLYTSSSGCLCKSEDIQPMIMSRGGNRMIVPLPQISETIVQEHKD